MLYEILPFRVFIAVYIFATALSVANDVDDPIEANNDVDPNPATTAKVKTKPNALSKLAKSNTTKSPIIIVKPATVQNSNTKLNKTSNLSEKISKKIADLFYKVMSNKKVKKVTMDVGTCMTNGLMDLITHFVPSPLVPLVAEGISWIIPFKPVAMFRDRLPVSSYGRAIGSALSSFMNTFDDYKLQDEEPDPYNTRRFNRRMMSERKNNVH